MRPVMFNVSVAVILSLVPQDITILAPTEPQPVGTMVELRIKTDDTLPNIAVQAIGRNNFDVVKVYQTTTPGLWVFTGPEDEYLVTVTAAGPDGIAQESIKCLIGPRPPPVDPEVPETPGAKTSTIVYPDEDPIPLHAEGAVNDLRAAGETVFLVSDGATTINGTTPTFLQPAINAAEEVGVPALVVQKGTTVVKKMPLPDTKEEIISEVEAVK